MTRFRILCANLLLWVLTTEDVCFNEVTMRESVLVELMDVNPLLAQVIVGFTTKFQCQLLHEFLKLQFPRKFLDGFKWIICLGVRIKLSTSPRHSNVFLFS